MDDLVYGRKAFLARRGPVFFVDKRSQGSHFFFTKKDLSSQIVSSVVDWEELVPLAASNFLEEDLNLKRLPHAYAQSQRDKVLNLGPYISNLGKSIVNCLNTKDAAASAVRRVLVKNAAQAFWINIDQRYFPLLQKRPRQDVYLGLHWERAKGAGASAAKIVNLPSPVYMLTEAQVPKVFLWEWETLQNVVHSKIHRKDIYFLKLKILDLKSEQEGHETEIR